MARLDSLSLLQRMSISKPVHPKNLMILERFEALQACEKLSSTGSVTLGDTKCTEFRQVAAHFQVGKALISKIKNASQIEKDKLRRKAKSLPNVQKQSGSGSLQSHMILLGFHDLLLGFCVVFFLCFKSSYFDLLEKAVFEWICSLKASSLPVTVALVKEKALSVSRELVERYKDSDLETQNKLHITKLREFAASSQWYKNFARRFSIKTGKQAGLFIIYVSSSSMLLFSLKAKLPLLIWKWSSKHELIFKQYSRITSQKIYSILMSLGCFGNCFLIGPDCSTLFLYLDFMPVCMHACILFLLSLLWCSCLQKCHAVKR
jgi:Tc5 transposase DNA-binding domain